MSDQTTACDACESEGRNCTAHGGRPGIPYHGSDQPSTPASDAVSVEEALRRFRWACDPEFEQRYATDTWVFNLANALAALTTENNRLRGFVSGVANDSWWQVDVPGFLRQKAKDVLGGGS